MSNAAADVRRLGLDPSFAAEGFEQLAENALCSICHDYLDVVETDCEARHIFCRPCLQIVYDMRKPCPECRGHFSKIDTAHIRIRSSIEQVKWKCLNHESGCKFTGTKKELERHLDNECEEQETGCPFEGCGERNHRTVISQHKTGCAFRKVPCDHCTQGVPFNAMVQHLSVCDKVPVPCPNGCGQNPPRGELSVHKETDCGEETVSCEVPGCGQQVKRKEMEGHEEESMKKHMRLLTTQLLTNKRETQLLINKRETTKIVKVYMPEYETKAAGLNKGDRLTSAAFSFQNWRFHIWVYPKGEIIASEGKASV
uniref:RING-type domain-containing protein n=1 Tax=Chromera velia CCMP2878 TaxID=1169474 RepID=A0A0G4H0X7_9ALVE|eukprot:Cvel_24223.t1-p1 / transcript=Cvel_24223.t1 / gene=Cvel_24223 / organism=Chromera_velia_CCMP2878 / gene_product=TNF receptor-associated factor 4, putative / transcript_product=TNF receptor-associated factor 4, putative / location=Cvel_scaffold2590:7568-9127(-) / protein_length=311 / sequence_SO=supercontig / SO=protein_coding / is_pseudo=false